ncbi:hypothetical protein Y032_0640g1014 [Ancylostoma ceylanicum]|uniref:Uncharacterized protein n=1 Tax=Ancylostoma ceylanicum TaxID=53326 RepID=A0A016WJH7_9BILA|nr:hypothetical protein Y032_0640g1014 [Ancylostoma ceylanicum]
MRQTPISLTKNVTLGHALRIKSFIPRFDLFVCTATLHEIIAISACDYPLYYYLLLGLQPSISLSNDDNNNQLRFCRWGEFHNSLFSSAVEEVANALSCGLNIDTRSRIHDAVDLPPPVEALGYALHDPPLRYTRERAPTALELVDALATGNSTPFAVPVDMDQRSQDSARPRNQRLAVQLAQSLTLAANFDHVFDSNHLGARDYVMLDNFVNNDLFRHIRSAITGEIVDPASNQRAHPLVRDLPVFLVVQALKGVNVQTSNLIQLNKDVATHIASWDSADELLLWIHRLTNAIDNVYAHRTTIDSELLPIFFTRPSDAKNIVDLLAHFGVNTNTITVTYATATAACRQGFHNIARIRDKLLLGNFTRTCPPSYDETPILHTFPHHQPTPAVAENELQTAVPARPSSTPASCSRSATEVRARSQSPYSTSETQRSFSSHDAAHDPPRFSREHSPLNRSVSLDPVEQQFPPNFEGCLFCSQAHFSASCERMESLKARMERIVNQARCVKCLGTHLTEECRRYKKCIHCSSRDHHPSLCYLNENVNQDLPLNYAKYITEIKRRSSELRQAIDAHNAQRG